MNVPIVGGHGGYYETPFGHRRLQPSLLFSSKHFPGIDTDERADVNRGPLSRKLPSDQSICDRKARVRSCFGLAKNSAGGPSSTITPPSVKYM